MSITIISNYGGTLYVAENAQDVHAAVIEAVRNNADLRGAYLCGANLGGADLDGAKR